ncbi:MAG: glutamate-1-semialdehyde 2,1-aminomutase [Sporomusaceae bacterium]|nr:glutamate-1-semialdehyde 2,1-aminomutase [Sporomusaceae bacterium]
MAFSLEKSAAAFLEAKKYIPGGVNSPVRSFRSVGGTPPFIASAHGAHIQDIDGNDYIDYVLSWGPCILGHSHDAVTKALQEAVTKGTSFGAPTLLETEVAKLVQEIMPNIERVRMVNSGTEATMSALRLARAFTGRSKIVKFEGCYHGHHDSLLVKAGSGAATFGVPDSPGVPAAVANTTITVPYNDSAALEAVFAKEGSEIAAVIIEPIAGNMGLVLPKDGYLAEVRRITKQYDSLLIFDEVMCGFRCAFGGAQELYQITPDITCLGKVIGGGLPVAAYGGRADIMDMISPAGPVYQAGTLSGNPLAMTAGYVTLNLLKENAAESYKLLTEKTTQLCQGIRSAAESYGLHYQYHQIGSMFGMFFSNDPVTDYESATKSDLAAFTTYFHAMLRQGIYMAPSQFECAFMSLAHSDEDIAKTIAASKVAFGEVVKSKK